MKHLQKFEGKKEKFVEKKEKIKIDAWVTFQDGQDGSYSVRIFGSRKEAVESLGKEPEVLYEDGGIDKVELEIVNKDGKWILKSNDYASFG